MSPNPRVLVVEDDEISFKLVSKILKPLPLDIRHAPTGAEAVAALNEGMPDLIILDINLPDMRGWDVLDKFKNDARLNRSRVIVLTAHDAPVQRVIGSLQAVAVFMAKPVKPDDLRRQVRQLLSLDA